jgi:pyruvate/2-oxoglutarate dehydrogenase complex dihydrolipoamide acyltransferase (E2) component
MQLVLLVTPAAAKGDLELVVPDVVTGTDPLAVMPEGDDAPSGRLSLTVVDAEGNTAEFFLPGSEMEEGSVVSVDLRAPDSGSLLVNGPQEITLTRGTETLAVTETVLDAAPLTPVLSAVVRGQRVGLTWEPVAAAGDVVYRLERIATDSDWTVIDSGTAADGHTERDLEPGRYRYRLSAGVPAADGEGMNWSGLSAVQVRIAKPAAQASPAPSPSPDASEPAAAPAPQPERSESATSGARDGSSAEKARESRRVAASGHVRAPVAPERSQRLETATAPAVAPEREPAAAEDDAAPHVAAPEVAPAATAAPTPAAAGPVARIDPLPVPAPIGGTLAVQAANTTDPVTLGTGAVFLVVAGAVAAGARRRRPWLLPALRRLSPSQAGRR